MKKILFVCTGNTCRSPMAAALFQKLAVEKGRTDLTAQSAGLAAADGEPASRNAVAAMAELGVNLSGHKARLLKREMLEESDSVYAISASHRAAILRVYPEFSEKVRVLGGGIVDPFGGDLNVYRRCRDEIAAALKTIGDWSVS